MNMFKYGVKEMRQNSVVCKYIQDFLHGPNHITRGRRWQNGMLHLNASKLHHYAEPSHEESLPLEWYKEEFPKLTKLTKFLKNIDMVDGRLVNIDDNSTINDERLLRRMHHFKSLARAFLGASSVQEELKKNVASSMAERKANPPVCFTKLSERHPMTVNSLSKVSDFLNISAQQRKTVRLTICPQVTQHRIWTGALEETLKGLKTEIEFLGFNNPSNKGTFMGQQIVSTCLKFLAETASCRDEDASSWMRPLKHIKKPKSKVEVDVSSSRKWEEVLAMFNDLIDCLRDEEGFSFHVTKLEAMKEGLTQIKDVLIDREIGFKEVKHHESLVQKKLTKTLGHSSRCLFTLVRYYLHETIRDMEVEVSGGLCEVGDKERVCLCMGKIVTSDEENMVRSGIKQLDRALGLFELVWKTAEVKRKLELQGHMWCVGAESRTIRYRGNLFFVHGISL